MNDDLGENKAHLFCTSARAVPGDMLIDLGVREGASSFTMLAATAGQQCRVVGVDPSPCPFPIPERYQYLQIDSVRAAPLFSSEPIFLVFIDTLHIKEQVMAELFHYWPMIRVGGYAVCHDTDWPPEKHDEYLGKTWDQAVEGVNAFFPPFIANEDYIRVDYKDSWGMTFVKKLRDWNPVVPGMEEALRASRQLTDALCGPPEARPPVPLSRGAK